MLIRKYKVLSFKSCVMLKKTSIPTIKHFSNKISGRLKTAGNSLFIQSKIANFGLLQLLCGPCTVDQISISRAKLKSRLDTKLQEGRYG